MPVRIKADRQQNIHTAQSRQQKDHKFLHKLSLGFVVTTIFYLYIGMALIKLWDKIIIKIFGNRSTFNAFS